MNTKVTIAALAISTALFGAAPALAGGYLKIGDIKGQARDAQHKDWINLLSVSHSVSRPAAAPARAVARARTSATLGDVVVVKSVDSASPKLNAAAASGRVFPEVEIHFTRGSQSQPYYSLKLTKARVTSISASVSDEEATEELSLNFEKVTWTYHQGAGGEVSESWNARTAAPQ